MKKPLITEIDNIETKRVLNAIKKRKIVLNLVAIFIIVGLIPFSYFLFENGKQIVIYVLWSVFALFYFACLIYIYKTFNPLLETAKLNDKIRHEEKVRNVERDKHNLEKEIERLKKELEILKKESKNSN